MKSSNRPGRVASLDGLRGVAALVVLVHHLARIFPDLDDARAAPIAVTNGLPAVLTWSPLHVLWEGRAAVLVFFVISGYVLTLSAPRTLGRWVGFLPARLVRLALPAMASVALAFALATIAPRAATPLQSMWVAEQMIPLTAVDYVQAALLRESGAVNGPLWSLTYEVLFSLLLPLFLIGVLRSSSPWPLPASLVATFGVTLVGEATDNVALYHVPAFVLGILLARHHRELARAVSDLSGRHWAGVCCVTVLLLTAPWTFGGLTGAPLPGGETLQSLGALLTVAVAIHWTPAARALSRPSCQRAGTYSFSLYLVHMPLLLAVLALLPAASHLTVVAWTLTLTLPVTFAFHHLVDRPVQQASGTLRRFMTSTWESAQASPARPTTPAPRT